MFSYSPSGCQLYADPLHGMAFSWLLFADGTAHGMLLMSSNGMDVVITEDTMSFRILGGILDLYIFAGPTPMQVLEQLTRVIGRPALPPFWSLGFHQCK